MADKITPQETDSTKDESLETEEIKEVEETKKDNDDSILLASDIHHNVTRVIDVKKGNSLFKFGRRNGNNKVIPTRVPRKYGLMLLDTRPYKYKEVRFTSKKDPQEYYAKLIEDQDAADEREEEKLLKQRMKEDEERLKLLQAEGKVKKIIRE